MALTNSSLYQLYLLNVYFIVHYHLFFAKKFIFSNVYISVNTIFECLYTFLVEKGAINPVRMQLVGRWGVIQNMHSCIQEKEGATSHVCVRNYTIFFHVFWQHFCLIVSSSVLFVDIFNFIFTQKNTFIRNGYYYIKILF